VRNRREEVIINGFSEENVSRKEPSQFQARLEVSQEKCLFRRNARWDSYVEMWYGNFRVTVPHRFR